MNKNLKTLLLVSAITLPISACSGNVHTKTDNSYQMNKMHCKTSRHLEKAKYSAENTLKALDEAVANTSDEATKKRLQKIVKDADKLSNEISQCKKMCDAKMSGEEPATKKTKHKKAAHTTKHDAPAAAPAAPTTAPASAKQPEKK